MRKNGEGVWGTSTLALLVIAAFVGFIAGVADVGKSHAFAGYPSDLYPYTYDDDTCQYPDAVKDPVNIVFVEHGFPSVIRDHAEIHGGWEKNGGTVQYFGDLYGCFPMDNASASRNFGSRFHMRYYNHRVPAEPVDEVRMVAPFSTYGVIASAAAHHEDLVWCSGLWPKNHSVDDDSHEYTIKGKTVRGGFNRGREDIRKNWVIPNGDHALEAILYWDNVDWIYQCVQLNFPYNQDVARSDGDVYYIRAFDLTDGDGDGCDNVYENGSDPTHGGLRDPADPWDYYDVSVPKDGVIDLLNDILGVIFHYQPAIGGAPPYNAYYDRGPSQGPNVWNMTAPDGVIDLLNDILGVIQQYSPTGCN